MGELWLNTAALENQNHQGPNQRLPLAGERTVALLPFRPRSSTAHTGPLCCPLYRGARGFKVCPHHKLPGDVGPHLPSGPVRRRPPHTQQLPLSPASGMSGLPSADSRGPCPRLRLPSAVTPGGWPGPEGCRRTPAPSPAVSAGSCGACAGVKVSPATCPLPRALYGAVRGLSWRERHAGNKCSVFVTQRSALFYLVPGGVTSPGGGRSLAETELRQTAVRGGEGAGGCSGPKGAAKTSLTPDSRPSLDLPPPDAAAGPLTCPPLTPHKLGHRERTAHFFSGYSRNQLSCVRHKGRFSLARVLPLP